MSTLTTGILAYWKLENTNDSVASYDLTNIDSTPFAQAKLGKEQ